MLQEALDKLVADQQRQLMDDPACDKVSRLETVSNHATTDGVTAAVRYKQSETDETEHRFGIGMVSGRLDDFMALSRRCWRTRTCTSTGSRPPSSCTCSATRGSSWCLSACSAIT